MEIKHSVLDVEGGKLFYRHTFIQHARPTLLFIHGLGDSGLCFTEAFRQPMLTSYSILAIDLLGFGMSSSADGGDYSFNSQIRRINHLLDYEKLSKIIMVGHSMGGNIGTLFCNSHPDRVIAFIDIEGNLTPDDLFISNLAVEAEKEGRFEAWFRNDFRERVINWCYDRPSCIRYLASLQMCRPSAFLGSARQVCELNTALPGARVGVTGQTYQRLKIPKIFCWGSESLSRASRSFLAETGLANQEFHGASHWLMLDKIELFYGFLSGFLTELSRQHLREM